MFSITVVNTLVHYHYALKPSEDPASLMNLLTVLFYVRALEQSLAPYFIVIVMNSFQDDSTSDGKRWNRLRGDLKFKLSST